MRLATFARVGSRTALAMLQATALLTVLATVLACTPPAARAVAVPVAAPRERAPKVALDEDRPENPYPEWIIADWGDTDRATRTKLIAYAKRAEAWTDQCKKGFAALSQDASAVEANVAREIAAVPAGGSPYDAFDAFRAVEMHFTQERARIVRERSLGPSEASFLLDPIEHRIEAALVEWERRVSPLLVGSAGIRPLGVTWPAPSGAGGVDREALYCRGSRDHGTQSAPTFFAPSELRTLVRRPFEATPAATAPVPPLAPAQSGSEVDGVVQSVATSGSETRVTFEHAWHMLERRPPCHLEVCKGIDCGMVPGGGRRTVCREVMVPYRARFVALFTVLPRGLVLRKGDVVSFQAAEEFEIVPPFRALFHAVVLDWVQRPTGAVRPNVFSLSPK